MFPIIRRHVHRYYTPTYLRVYPKIGLRSSQNRWQIIYKLSVEIKIKF